MTRRQGRDQSAQIASSRSLDLHGLASPLGFYRVTHIDEADTYRFEHRRSDYGFELLGRDVMAAFSESDGDVVEAFEALAPLLCPGCGLRASGSGPCRSCGHRQVVDIRHHRRPPS